MSPAPPLASSRPSARFDDLTPAGTGLRLSAPVQIFEAFTPDEVVTTLDAAYAAAVAGYWVAGFVSYEAAAGLNPRQPLRARATSDPLAGLPLVWFAAFSTCDTATIDDIGDIGPDDDRLGDDRPDYDCLDDEMTRWRGFDQQWHATAVAAVREHIAGGQVYQANLTTRLHSHDHVDAHTLYRRLAAAQRGAYNALIHTGQHTVICASPELFFDWDGDTIRTCPMKGTRKRGKWTDDDQHQALQLQNSPKERAENTMITDLIRNDLARIATIGSVGVTRFLEVQRYPTLWQLTSTVEATTLADITFSQVFQALFPSGSVTGAPKQAAMGVIAEQETSPRGVYCGAVGYLSPGTRPHARFAVAIRTATRDDVSGYTEYGTGGGIVWDSHAASEWKELQAKAAILAGHRAIPPLLETMRYDPGTGVHNIGGHLRRLRDSASYFGIHFHRGAIVAALRAQLSDCDTAMRLRLLLNPDGTVQVELLSLPEPRDVVLLVIAGKTVYSDDVRLYHKSADRRLYQRIRDSAPAADDAVLVNERGEITETTIANLVVRDGERWYTPPVRSGLLPGVERARLLRTHAISERVITVPQLQAADEIAVISSLRGWCPARLLRD